MRDLDPTVDSSEIRRTSWKGKFIRLFTGIYIQGFKNIPGGDRRISSIVLIFKCFFVIPRFWGLFSTLRTMVIALCVHFGCLHEGGLGNESFVEIKMARGNNEKESLYIPGTHVCFFLPSKKGPFPINTRVTWVTGTLEVQPPFFIGWFPNHHYFSRDLSSSKRNGWLPGNHPKWLNFPAGSRFFCVSRLFRVSTPSGSLVIN